ncbi:hypothetical protein KAF25_006292 [Fusarium avenaceum]|uniref:Uncharacterized protein n=1 Tax=Fusarium avenaceum TaxID=40199 RepID=A0A9P7H687_9HYPO|nr:hypothetical protein KAF25_006292 [Fusarium avenaceum]
MVVTIILKRSFLQPDPDDESSRYLQVPGPQGYREIVDLTDERFRPPQDRESRDRFGGDEGHRGHDEGHRGRDKGSELLSRAVITRFTDVVDDRQRDTQVTSHDQLTTEEKQKIGVWLRQSSDAIYAGLPDPGGPSVVDRTATEARTPVGTLKVDAPFSRNQIRKSTETQKSVCRAGKPVTCGVTLNYETDGLAFTWKDRQGAEISYDIISFKSGLDQSNRHDIRY